MNSYRLFTLLISILIAQPIAQAGVADDFVAKFQSFKNAVAPYSQYLLPAAVTVGTLSIAHRFLSVKQMATTAASLGCAGAVLYGYKYLQHKFALDRINRIIDLSRNPNSTVHKDAQSETFRFCTWPQKSGDNKWPTALDVDKHKEAVRKKLREDVESGTIPVYDRMGHKLYTKKISAADIKRSIANEQQELISYLAQINRFSSVAPIFINKFTHFAGLKETGDSPVLTDDEKMVLISNKLTVIPNSAIDAVINQVKISIVKTYAGNGLYMPSYNPAKWTIAPHLERAVEVYGKIFKALIRLNALNDAAASLNFQAPKPVGSVANQVEKIKDELEVMLVDQPTVDGNKQRQNIQIAHLVEVTKQLNSLMHHVTAAASKKIIDAIVKELDAIGEQIRQSNHQWTDDIINRLQNNVLPKLDLIK